MQNSICYEMATPLFWLGFYIGMIGCCGCCAIPTTFYMNESFKKTGGDGGKKKPGMGNREQQYQMTAQNVQPNFKGNDNQLRM